MPEMNKVDLLAAWLEGTLTDSQREQFEALCSEDKEFAEQVQGANHMLMEAESYQPASVPEWDRESTFAAPEKSKWWQWQGMPAFSLGTSLVAIVMVMSGFQISVHDGAMTISFTSQPSQAQIQAMVDEKLDTFQQNQQLALANYAQSIQQQQLDASTQLTNYLLASSRQERREDFAELIKFINEQRSDDQMFFARQLNKLEKEIYADPQ